ncbi:DUF4836 family protein [Verrucomicrobia bacterium]|nr:DUF4836 family protein [Verrucomicrobiota bacterium]
MNIYIFKNEQQFGPYSVEQLREYVQQGHFTLEDYACGDGQNWIPLAQIPGFAAQAQAGQPQQAQVPQVGAQVPQAQVGGGIGFFKGKVIVLSILLGIGCVAALVATLTYFLGGDDDPSENQLISSESSEEKDSETIQEDEEDKDDGDVKGGSSGTDDKDKEPEQPSGESATSLADVPLLDRIPADALAIANLDLGKLLQKGNSQMVSLLASELESKGWPPNTRDVLMDPSLIGLDVSKPARIFLLRHPTKADEDPTIGIAIKLEDSSKMKQFFLRSSLAPNLVDKTETKEGYDHWKIDADVCHLAVASDFLFFILNEDNRAGTPYLTEELQRFMTSDGAGSLVETNESFQAFAKESHDAAIWVNGASLAQLPDASDEIPEEFSDLIKGGSGVITLDFDNGEAVLAGELQVPEGFERFGKGGLSEGSLNLIPAKALAALSLSLDMKAVVDYFENVALPAAGDPVSLDETIPELGLKPRDVLETFTGEISVALTEFSMGGGGPVPGEDLPGEPEQNPFGGGGDEQPAVEVDPFGGSPAPEPVTDEGFPGGASGGLPPGGPPAGGPGMGGGLPVEFIAALSVDPAKWEKLMEAPPLKMAMGLAMLQGISVTVKDERLLLASKKHMAEAMEGSVQDKLSGSEQSLFKDNDFALKLDIAEAAKQEDFSLPQPVMASLKKLSYLAITGKYDEKSSSGALRIGFGDKQTNSLNSLMETAPVLMQMLGAVAGSTEPPSSAAIQRAGRTDATEDGNWEGIAGEISAGADIDSQMGEDGETPLHRAATRGQLEAVKFLISKGANINIGREKDGKTALDLAESRGHEEIAEFLKNNGGKNSR